MYYVMNYSIINSDSLGYPKLGFWNTFLAILDNEVRKWKFKKSTVKQNWPKMKIKPSSDCITSNYLEVYNTTS